MAILESAANGMLMGMPKQMAPQTEESIIELMGRECVRQFFEVLRINPSLCRVFYDPQASFHYHKVASQTDFITDGQYMYSGKDNVVQALRNLDFVDASVDLLLVRSLEVNLASLLSSINNKEAYESSPPVAGSSSDTKHLLSTSVHGVLQTKSLEQYRIFMTMTTLVLGGHFKILTQSLVMWALSAAPPIMTNVALPGGATPYEYELAAAAAAAFNLQQAAQAPFMPPPQLMMNQFQPTADNVPNAATGILHQLQEPEANTADTFENYNISSSNDANSQQHRPSAVTGAPSSEQHPQSTANSSSATAQFINSDMNNSARNSIVSPRNPPTSTSPSEFISSSSPSVAAAAAQPSSDFGHAVSQQQRALSAATTPVNTLAGDGSRQQYDTNASSDHQHQQHDPYSNFKHQHQPQQQVLGGVAELNQQQQMNSSTDEGYASSLQNADGNGSVDMTSVHAMQYINNIVSQPPTGQILGQPAYNMLVAAPYMNAVNGPASIQHQPMKAYAAAFNNGVAQNQTIGMTQHSFGALQHGSDMPLQLNNGGLSYDQQQPPAYRGYYSTDQPHGGYGGGGYRGGRGGGFNSRGGYNRNFNRDGNFRGGGRGSGERSFNNNERNGGGPTANRGNRGGDGGPFGRNYSNNSSYADHQQQQSNSNNYAFNSNQRGGRDNRKPGVDQPSNASANNSDYRSLQPLPPPPPTSAQQQQQSTTAAVSLSNNVNGSAGGSPANSSRQPNTAVAASGGARPNR